MPDNVFRHALLGLAVLVAALICAPSADAQGQPMPDLVPGATVRLAPQGGGACWSAGAPLGLQVTVANSGTGPASAFSVDVNGARQRVAGLSAGQSTTLWFQGYAQGTNLVNVDVQNEVQNESNKGNNQLQVSGATLVAPPQCTASPTVTPTQTPTATPIGYQTPTPTGSATATPASASTSTPTALPPTPTSTPSAGITVSLVPPLARIRPGESVLVHVKVDWNPTNSSVELSQAAGDAISAAVAANAQWSPSKSIVGTGVTDLVIGTSGKLAPGLYTLNVNAKTTMGTNVQPLKITVLASSAQFESELLRRNEFPVFGPEMLPPYRGGDSFFYQPRVTGLLQWRPESNSYVNANTSELLDLSAGGPAAYRLPATVRDDGTGGNIAASTKLRLQDWLTDPAIKASYYAPPPGAPPSWDVNGSITLYGLPASKPTQIGPYVVQRFQRAVFRHWVAETPAHPEWRDSVAVIPLEQAALNFIPEIDPVAAGEIVRAQRGGAGPSFQGYWEIDAGTANGFVDVKLEAEDAATARVHVSNPTGLWLEASLIGPTGTQAELAAGQAVTSDWPGLPPLSWILEPGQEMILHVHPNQVHPDPNVRSSSVYHVWLRPSARAAMARVAQGMAAVGLPELGDLHGARLSAYYRALLTAASQSGAGTVGCLVGLDGDINAGDEMLFARDLTCAASTSISGYVMAQAAAAIGVGVEPPAVSARLTPGALIGRVGSDPATGWFFWNLQLDGREPGGRIRISHTGSASGG
ncbi:MAG TPA: CARDB domain-containing protein [Chloroflexota bacterium]